MSTLSPRPFYFLRHGQTDWNIPTQARLQGHSDVPLNELGEYQALTAAQRLAHLGLTRIVASPLSRALRTAQLANEFLNLPLTTCPLLMERSFGSLEGRVTAEVRAEAGLQPGQSITLALPPDAEPWPATKARITSAIATQLAEYPTDTILFVSHGANFRALVEELCGAHLESENCISHKFWPASDNDPTRWHVTTI